MSVWEKLYEIVDKTVKFESLVEVIDAVNTQNPLTKKLDVQRIDNDYGPVFFTPVICFILMKKC